MKTGAEKIKIQQAYEDGETVRCERIHVGKRCYLKADDGELVWDWRDCDYEVAPPPEPQVGDVWEMDDGAIGYIGHIKRDRFMTCCCLLFSKYGDYLVFDQFAQVKLKKRISTGHALFINELKRLLKPSS